MNETYAIDAQIAANLLEDAKAEYVFSVGISDISDPIRVVADLCSRVRLVALDNSDEESFALVTKALERADCTIRRIERTESFSFVVSESAEIEFYGALGNSQVIAVHLMSCSTRCAMEAFGVHVIKNGTRALREVVFDIEGAEFLACTTFSVALASPHSPIQELGICMPSEWCPYSEKCIIRLLTIPTAPRNRITELSLFDNAFSDVALARLEILLVNPNCIIKTINFIACEVPAVAWRVLRDLMADPNCKLRSVTSTEPSDKFDEAVASATAIRKMPRADVC